MQEDVRRICSEAYLKYVRSLKFRIAAIHEEIEALRATLELTGIQLNESVVTSTKGDTLEAGVIELQELIGTYCTELAEYTEAQEEAHKALSHLSRPEYIQALTLYYLCGKTWVQIRVKMNYSKQHMMAIRKAAVFELYDYLPEEWRRILPKAL